MSFVFYDTETTGTKTAFDQILQFGAIKTDYELNELDRFEIRSRILPYVVPSPGAMRVTGVSADQLTDPALPSQYEMVRAIRAKLAEWSPAIFIGHNSLGFDEHLLRQALYKTLHPPYLTNTNGNCRNDSLRMIQAVAHFAPDALSVPIDEQGRPVFKLDRLASANGFDHGAAHEAMADVEATIHMCQLIAERVPEYWSGFVRFSQKAAVNNFALEEDVFTLTEFYYGRPRSWIVTSIGINPENGSELFVFNLAVDPDELAGLSDDELGTRLTVSPKPVRGMRINAAPVVLAYDDSPDEIRGLAPELDELRKRAARLSDDDALKERLIETQLASRGERQPSVHVEEQIYDRFAGNDDQATMERFHQLEWPERFPLVGSLTDERLRCLGQRLIYTEAPDVLPAATRQNYEAAIAARLMADDDTVPWLTLPRAITEADDFLAVATGAEAALLKEHRDYLRQRAEWATAVLA